MAFYEQHWSASTLTTYWKRQNTWPEFTFGAFFVLFNVFFDRLSDSKRGYCCYKSVCSWWFVVIFELYQFLMVWRRFQLKRLIFVRRMMPNFNTSLTNISVETDTAASRDALFSVVLTVSDERGLDCQVLCLVYRQYGLLGLYSGATIISIFIGFM